LSTHDDVTNWWSTDIIRMEPGVIEIRGEPIEQLIQSLSFSEMIWLMTMGQRPSPGQHRLLEAALVAAVDHGPQAPSVATARMAMTCGVGINNALASGVNMLGDVHGGAGEQALMVFQRIAARLPSESLETAVQSVLDALDVEGVTFIPGFGHRFHKPTDPRAAPLMQLLRQTALDDAQVDGYFADIAEAVQSEIGKRKGRPIAMNIDGATAAIYAALEVPPTLARGLFCLSRSVGLTAHAFEQSTQGERNKGPTPPHYRWRYTGP
jgi:citrate synthase